MTFQLTTSRRGRRFRPVLVWGNLSFQLTTSRRGRPWKAQIRSILRHFNSLPHAEVDDMKGVFLWQNLHFNSLPHAEVDHRCSEMSLPDYVFQLTTSRRGRRLPKTKSVILRRFQLTTSRRGRHVIFWVLWGLSKFQLTTSRRGRRNICNYRIVF